MRLILSMLALIRRFMRFSSDSIARQVGMHSGIELGRGHKIQCLRLMLN